MLHLSTRMKATDVKAGEVSRKDGRLILTFKDAFGKQVGSCPQVFNTRGTTEWTALEHDSVIEQKDALLKTQTWSRKRQVFHLLRLGCIGEEQLQQQLML
jgi:hypothetical protein